jgi:hypothetical protein
MHQSQAERSRRDKEGRWPVDTFLGQGGRPAGPGDRAAGSVVDGDRVDAGTRLPQRRRDVEVCARPGLLETERRGVRGARGDLRGGVVQLCRCRAERSIDVARDAAKRRRIRGPESDAFRDEAQGNRRERDDEPAKSDAEKRPRGQDRRRGTCRPIRQCAGPSRIENSTRFDLPQSPEFATELAGRSQSNALPRRRREPSEQEYSCNSSVRRTPLWTSESLCQTSVSPWQVLSALSVAL